MNRTLRTTAFTFLLAGTAGLASAQNAVDIGLYQNNGVLEVKVRPEADFSGIFSSLVFTVRWDANSGATLGESVQDEAVASYIGVQRSGDIREEGGLRYAVYAGFGMNPMASSGNSWQAGREYTIARIPVTGQGEFELVNDAYTSDRKNNANFYAACGGTDRTGIIYKGLAPAAEDGSVLIQPNPNNGRFTLSFANGEKGDVTVEIINSIGQAVYNETVRDLEGTYRKEMDLSTMGAGAYYVKLKRNGNTTSHKVIYR
ncbi:MAG: T9SS type A sorting domain-containing protein [Flavobacteriales bacterium]|nr:T9SS type A sorting domain-containing protein [Flavobacteriales bacterium]